MYLQNVSKSAQLGEQMLKWGVLGTGRIANKVIPIVCESKLNQIVAVGSRNLNSAQNFAHANNVSQFFGSYQEVIDCKDTEAIYITLPNSLHFEWAYKALSKGKHVLCEKPLAMSAHETQQLVQLAQDKNVVLMEGFMYQFHHQTQTLIGILQNQKYGKVQSLYGCFHFQLADPNNIRLNKNEGGGALRDIGCYLVHFLSLAFQETPSEIKVIGRTNTTGVDTQLSVFCIYPSKITAHFTCSFEAPRRDYLEIICERAHFLVDRPFKPDLSSGVTIITDDEMRKEEWRDDLNPFRQQFDSFALATQVPIKNSINTKNLVLNAELIDAIAKQLEAPGFNNLAPSLQL